MMSPRSLLSLAAGLGAVTLVGCAPRATESPRTTRLESSAPAPANASVEPEPAELAEPLEEPVPEPPVEEAAADPEPDASSEAPGATVVDARAPDASAPDAGRVARPAPAACGAETWGGWDGTPSCRAASRRRVAGAHRRCETDDDCVFVSEGCHPHAVHRRHARRYQRWAGPCAGPGAGACSSPGDAICDQGCCVASHGFGRRGGPPSPLR